MDGYIEREATLREIERRESLMVGDKTISVDALKRFLLNRPAADVAPVRHGRWLPFHSTAAGDIQYCSACEIGCMWKPNYCPNCGAKMDGGDSDEAD